MTESAWDDVFATNLKGMLFSIKAALPHLKQSTAGRIVLTSSITGPLRATLAGRTMGNQSRDGGIHAHRRP